MAVDWPAAIWPYSKHIRPYDFSQPICAYDSIRQPGAQFARKNRGCFSPKNQGCSARIL